MTPIKHPVKLTSQQIVAVMSALISRITELDQEMKALTPFNTGYNAVAQRRTHAISALDAFSDYMVELGELPVQPATPKGEE